MSSSEESEAAASGMVAAVGAMLGEVSTAPEDAPPSTSDEEMASATLRAQQVLPTSDVLPLPDSSATINSTTVDESLIGQPMEPSTDAEATVIVHSDSSLEYGCPQDSEWSHSEVLQGSLTGSVVGGAGCSVSFTFTGDSVQMFGATGPKAGVFGCSTSSDLWKAVGWWSAYGTTPYFSAYQGSCTIQGLGFGKHTITMTNAPNNPKLMYFTGLRYTTNHPAVTWAAPAWSGCCPVYTFADGAATTVAPSQGSTESASPTSTGAVATSTASAAALDYDWKTVGGVSLAALGLVALASLLIGAMCCKKRGKKDEFSSLPKGTDPEKRPLKKRRRSKKHRRESDTSSSSGSGSD